MFTGYPNGLYTDEEIVLLRQELVEMNRLARIARDEIGGRGMHPRVAAIKDKIKKAKDNVPVA